MGCRGGMISFWDQIVIKTQAPIASARSGGGGSDYEDFNDPMTSGGREPKFHIENCDYNPDKMQEKCKPKAR